MKVIVVLLVLLTVCALNSPVAGAELAAYYSFDDSSTLNRDDSGNGNNLMNIWTKVSPDYTPLGSVGGAAQFDGATQAFDTRLTYTDPPLYPEGSFTVSLWINPQDTSAFASISQAGTSLVGGFIVYINNGKYCAGVYAGGSSYGFETTVAAAVGQWAHLVLVFEASGEAVDGVYPGTLYCYINGVLTHTKADVFYVGGNTPISFGLGSRAGGSYKFKGILDEFAVFSGILTEPQISALAHKQTNILDVLDYVAPVQGPSPAAYYSFDDPNVPSYGLAFDDSGNGSNLRNDYAAMPDFILYGAVGGAALFNGTSQGFDLKLSLTNPPIYPNGSFTVAMWVKPDTAANTDCSITMPASTAGGYGIHIAGGTYRINTYTASTVTLNTGVAMSDKWTHLAVVFDADGMAGNEYTGTIYFYADGDLVLQNPMHYKPDGYRFGLANRAGGTRFYKGGIDEFAVWQTALSSIQIAGLANGDYTPADVPYVSEIIGDFNNDGIVNLSDFTIISGDWLGVSH